MPIATINFEHPFSIPKYIFGDRVTIVSNAPTQNWLVGKVIGIVFEEKPHPRWCYVVKLDFPYGFTEEYPESQLVLEQEKPSPFSNPDYTPATASAVWTRETLNESY